MVQRLNDCRRDVGGVGVDRSCLRGFWFGAGSGSCVREDGVGRASFELARGVGVEGEGVLSGARELC